MTDFTPTLDNAQPWVKFPTPSSKNSAINLMYFEALL